MKRYLVLKRTSNVDRYWQEIKIRTYSNNFRRSSFNSVPGTQNSALTFPLMIHLVHS